MCAFVWLPEEINVFLEMKVFKCFLCECVANDAGSEATGGPPQELYSREAPCFRHTGVTFDAENDKHGPSSLRGHFEAGRGRFV